MNPEQLAAWLDESWEASIERARHRTPDTTKAPSRDQEGGLHQHPARTIPTLNVLRNL